MDSGSRAPRLGPLALALGIHSRVILFGCTSPPTQHFQAELCRCSRWVASIIERIDFGCAGNLMGVLIRLTAAFPRLWGCSEAKDT